MKKLASAIVAATMAGIMAIPAPAVAQQGYEGQYQQVENRYIIGNGNNWRGNNWRYHNRDRWDRWDRHDRRHYRNRAFGGVAAGIFGFAAGAAIAGAINNGGYSSHVARCEARYRSYNPRTDMFKGYDGQWHRCRL